jgi:hypothetical protein
MRQELIRLPDCISHQLRWQLLLPPPLLLLLLLVQGPESGGAHPSFGELALLYGELGSFCFAL